jgi:hypothetical protein
MDKCISNKGVVKSFKVVINYSNLTKLGFVRKLRPKRFIKWTAEAAVEAAIVTTRKSRAGAREVAAATVTAVTTATIGGSDAGVTRRRRPTPRSRRPTEKTGLWPNVRQKLRGWQRSRDKGSFLSLNITHRGPML